MKCAAGDYLRTNLQVALQTREQKNIGGGNVVLPSTSLVHAA